MEGLLEETNLQLLGKKFTELIIKFEIVGILKVEEEINNIINTIIFFLQAS